MNNDRDKTAGRPINLFRIWLCTELQAADPGACVPIMPCLPSVSPNTRQYASLRFVCLEY